MIRSDGRSPEELRQVTIEPGYLLYAEGSALIKTGDTAVLCAVTVEDGVPLFARGAGSGWITAEYGMLPRPTLTAPPPRRGGRGHPLPRPERGGARPRRGRLQRSDDGGGRARRGAGHRREPPLYPRGDGRPSGPGGGRRAPPGRCPEGRPGPRPRRPAGR